MVSLTQVIKLPDQSRYILQRQDQHFLLFHHSCTKKENDCDIEYWKCAVRFCSVRICSRGTSFQLLSELENHHHNSNSVSSTTIAFLLESQSFVEKTLYPSKMRSRPISTPIRDTSLSLPIEVESTNQNGSVLKQLLLTSNEDVIRSSKKTVSKQSSIMSRTPSSVQQSSPVQLTNKRKQTTEPRRLAESNGHVARPTTPKCVRDSDYWSPPVLTPPPDGRAYSPPSTPVAHIEPYVEPQVMYNPYFLWQLYSYKQSCSNSFNSFSHNY
ncbi:uncharacterized protein LOC124352648 [Daphnia pulicaria]|uniref:uncharacterized protein LOC124352648 n=1 Tax=Daphnia pulicaria TaxID=35523 RepID=UPI001EEB56BC|nr:uncharacterized protein LOC124352648 [Daphnia pulicaria]